MWIWLLVLLTGSPPPDQTVDHATEILVARYRGGVVTASEMEAFRHHREWVNRGKPGRAVADSVMVEKLVLLEILAEQAVAAGLDRKSGHAFELGQIRETLAAGRLRQVLEAETRPSEETIRAYYDANRADFSRPRRWQLSNVFKKAADTGPESERRRVRQHLQDLRRKIEEGEDFAELARRESDSSSRFLGGRAGIADLASLRPEVAEAVASLGPGDLSEVIETGEGFILLYCHRVLEARTTAFEEARENIRRGLGRQAFEARWQVLSSGLRKQMSPAFDIAAARTGDPGTPAVTYRVEDGEAAISAADYRVYAASKPQPKTPTEDLCRRWLDERWLLRARATEARRRGLLDEEDFRRTLRWREQEFFAALVLDEAAKRQAEPVTQEQVAAFYTEHRASFTEPAAVRVRAVRVLIDLSLGRELYLRLENATEKARQGGLRLDEIPDFVDRDGNNARLLDLGWLTDRALTTIGVRVRAAVESMHQGEISTAIQEDDHLFVLELLERREEQPMDRVEAERRIRRRLERASLTAARRTFEQEVLAAQEIVLLP
jgi:parvulin-like peptidyl-prolyl isomerase